MNIVNDQGNFDYVSYIANQLPKDLANLIKIRDELAIRQGALSAVEAAAKDRELAKQELQNAKEEAEKLKKESNELMLKNKQAEAFLFENKKQFEENSSKQKLEIESKEKILLQKEKQLKDKEEALTKLEAETNKKSLILDSLIKDHENKV
jgi:histidinol-phosphate/aromatic aminotransferase/cobyric acid decarboxylase-like protein